MKAGFIIRLFLFFAFSISLLPKPLEARQRLQRFPAKGGRRIDCTHKEMVYVGNEMPP